MRNKPNVIFILTDDQGTLDANCYGAKHLYTPNIDRLAAEGIKFNQAYSHTVCCPARANLLTGRHTQRAGVNFWTQCDADAEWGINIIPTEATAGDVFRQHGYTTGMFGKWHLGAAKGHRPLDMGFDEFFGHLGGFIENYTHHFLHGAGFHDLWDGNERIDRAGEYFPRMMNHRALDFIERKKDESFFLYLPYNLPHYPEQSEDKFADQYKNVEERVREYGMTISTLDAMIGEVVDKIDALGLREDTIILFMSDNGHSRESYCLQANHKSGLPEGWYYGSHGAGYTGPYAGSKGSLYEGGIRVPCILSAPGRLPEGVEDNQPVCGIDWLPTALSLCGFTHTTDKPFDGLDLSEALTAERAIGSAAFSEDQRRIHPVGGSVHQTRSKEQTRMTDMPSASEKPGLLTARGTEDRTIHLMWEVNWVVIKGDWKLIGSAEGERRRLVNINEACPERLDYMLRYLVKDEYSAIAAELEAEHDAWMASVGGYKNEAWYQRDRE